MTGPAKRIAAALLGFATLAGTAALLALLPDSQSVSSPPGVWRRNKLGPAAVLRLDVDGECSSSDGAGIVDLVLTVEPGADLPGSTIEFLIPRGWEVLDGEAVLSEDLVFGKTAECRLKARLTGNAPRGAGARIRWRGLARETYLLLEGAKGCGLDGGRLDQDAFGNPIRVFPAAEKD